MSADKSLELRVSVDVGYRRHSVAMGLSSGEVLEEFEIDHRPEGFQEFWQASVADANMEHSRCYKSPTFFQPVFSWSFSTQAPGLKSPQRHINLVVS